MSKNHSHGTNGLLFIVDPSIYDVEVKKVNVINGDLLKSTRFIDKDFHKNAYLLIELIFKEKPEKIVFNKVGIGVGFYDIFMKIINDRVETYGISVDSFGNVTYDFFNLNPTYNITINFENNNEKDANKIAEEIMKQIKKCNINLGNGNI